MTRILLAEDDRLIAHLVSALLARQGHQVETVTSVEATVGRLETGTGPDVVLLDVHMPDGTARDVLRRLDGAAVPPIVLLTGTRREELGDLVDDPRVRAVLSKPVTPEALGSAVRAALGAADTP